MRKALGRAVAEAAVREGGGRCRRGCCVGVGGRQPLRLLSRKEGKAAAGAAVGAP